MPLEGLKILDLSNYLAGPYCSMMLADLGADVLKVEQPGTGDGSRQWGPPFIENESAYFLSINRNKKSMTLNLKTEKGKKILHTLATQSDVFLENYRPGVTQKLNIDYETLSKLNPRLIYCSISGYGQDGPYRVKPAYDLIGQAMGGLMSLTGEKGGAPVKVGVAIADICSGMFAAIGILAALRAREKTGRGQMIDTSILDGQVAWLSHQAGNFLDKQEPGKAWICTPNHSAIPSIQGSRHVLRRCSWKRESLEDILRSPRPEQVNVRSSVYHEP